MPCAPCPSLGSCSWSTEALRAAGTVLLPSCPAGAQPVSVFTLHYSGPNVMGHDWSGREVMVSAHRKGSSQRAGWALVPCQSEIPWGGEEQGDAKAGEALRKVSRLLPSCISQDSCCFSFSFMLLGGLEAQLCPCLAKLTLRNTDCSSVKVAIFLGVFCFPGCV